MMLSELVFTPMTRETLDACTEIAQHAPDPWKREALERAIGDENRWTFVALEKGRPVAFACFLAIVYSCDLEMLVVAPPVRKQGVAKLLLKKAFATLAAQAVASCLLEVRASNTAAIHLYESLGFRQLALRRGMYSLPLEDGQLMVLNLHEYTEGTP